MRGKRVLNFDKMWMGLRREFPVLPNELETLETILKGIWGLGGEVDVLSQSSQAGGWRSCFCGVWSQSM